MAVVAGVVVVAAGVQLLQAAAAGLVRATGGLVAAAGAAGESRAPLHDPRSQPRSLIVFCHATLPSVRCFDCAAD